MTCNLQSHERKHDQQLMVLPQHLDSQVNHFQTQNLKCLKSFLINKRKSKQIFEYWWTTLAYKKWNINFLYAMMNSPWLLSFVQARLEYKRIRIKTKPKTRINHRRDCFLVVWANMDVFLMRTNYDWVFYMTRNVGFNRSRTKALEIVIIPEKSYELKRIKYKFEIYKIMMNFTSLFF